MKYISQLIRFWFVISLVALAAYVTYFNRGSIPVSLPPILAEGMNLPAFMVYLSWFLAGAFFAWSFFSLDLLRKSFRIRSLRKQLAKATKLAAASQDAVNVYESREGGDSRHPREPRIDVAMPSR